MKRLWTTAEAQAWYDSNFALNSFESNNIDRQTDWVTTFDAQELVTNLIKQSLNEIELLLKEQAKDRRLVESMWFVKDDTRLVISELHQSYFALEINRRYERVDRLRRELEKHNKTIHGNDASLREQKRASDAQLERIRRLPLIDIFTREGITTQRRGGVHVCNCPFHDENTPSCTIFDSHFHCFGCQRHGDSIDLIKHLKNMSFVSAVSYLGDL